MTMQYMAYRSSLGSLSELLPSYDLQEFIDAASKEISERSQKVINLKCECEEIAGVKGFVSRECQQLAETVVVLKARMEYHTNMMRHLGGLIEDRPPKDPPEVPEPSTLCKE